MTLPTATAYNAPATEDPAAFVAQTEAEINPPAPDQFGAGVTPIMQLHMLRTIRRYLRLDQARLISL